MKALLASLIALAISITLLVLLNQQNNIASKYDPEKDYVSFNSSTPDRSQPIMNYWRAEKTRHDAVETIVWLDYILMTVYGVYLAIALWVRSKRENRRWLRIWLRAGICFVVTCVVLDFVQDTVIYRYVNTDLKITDMRFLSIPKWIALGLGVLPLGISFLPYPLLRYLSQLLQGIWLFFPSILFLLLCIFCFWNLGQGKDLIIAFINNSSPGEQFHFNYNRVIFFLIIGFWVYVSWYSSRIIAYVKLKHQGNKGLRKPFLDEFPRVIGNACFLILELAILQLPILKFELPGSLAWIAFILLLVIMRGINKWIDTRMNIRLNNPVTVNREQLSSFRRWFYILLFVLLGYVLVLSLVPDLNIMFFFALVVLFHVLFVYYINLRRADMLQKTVTPKSPTNWFEAVMEYFCIPLREAGYYKWFLGIGITGLIFYTINIQSIGFARGIGPFGTVLLGFGVLLLFGNTVTAFSVKYRINFHFLLFVAAFIIGFHETHYVRTIEAPQKDNEYATRPTLEAYLTEWLNAKHVIADTSTAGYDMYFIMANGGASRSGYWTATVLGTLEDSSIAAVQRGELGERFSDRIFCLSGTSGGGVGVATFFALLQNKQVTSDKSFARSAKAYLQQDYFTYTFARMLGPDFFNYIFPFISKKDRAVALEETFESSTTDGTDKVYPLNFSEPFSGFKAMKQGRINLPILCVNTTRMQDGNPGVVSNLSLDESIFNKRVDVVKLLAKPLDFSIASGSILSARFPYLSPAGRIGDQYFVDGGYFDNSGAGVVQEMIRGILTIGRKDSVQHGKESLLYQQVSKLRFKVLHITNSPVIHDSTYLTSVAPIKNDLLAPVLTIVGAYDMQTTVNDRRLMNFIDDVPAISQSKADYTQIPLYKDTAEWNHDPLRYRYAAEPAYAMNWFMSDTTTRRIDARLAKHPLVDSLIRAMKLGYKVRH
jgi:hypothetical protein